MYRNRVGDNRESGINIKRKKQIMKKKIDTFTASVLILIVFLFLPYPAKASWIDNLLSPLQILFEFIFPSPPEILEAKIEPIKVEPSDWMIISAKVKDKYGIESVKADMAGIELINLTLISGNEKEGIYRASWFVHSVEVGKTYNATIIARNVKGKESFFVLQFQDDPVFCCRRQINGSGTVVVTLNTQALISAGKMRSDCGDIRFTDSKSFDAAFWTRNFSYNIQGCWLQNWAFRIPIIIDNTQNYKNLTDYQVLVTINTKKLIWGEGIYELPINISSNTELTDYQVRINITDFSILRKITEDGRDIRFFNRSTNNPYSDTNGVLSYWIEEIIPNQKLIAWVKVPYIPANEEITIYMYYGNFSATSQSKMWHNIKHLNIYNGVFNYNASLGVNEYYSIEMQHRLGVAAGGYHTCVLKSNGNVEC
ncbi:MAG: DUF2341 domain-containing protein, partial [Thermoplasmata archaeon]